MFKNIGNKVNKVSVRGIFELVIAIVAIAAITMSMMNRNALRADNISMRIDAKKVYLAFEAYKTQSITFEELEKKEQLGIQVYVKRSFRAIPKSTAKLIAKSTTELSKKYGLPASLIVGMMKVESDFNPSAVSTSRARGLMQVRWSIWKNVLGEKLDMQEEFDLHNIREGIEAGIVVFKHYLEKNKGNVSRALYDYVGKDRAYVTRVYETMGRFTLYYGQGKFKE